MNNFNLSPYGFYILYAMLIITVICILLFLFKFFALNKALVLSMQTACQTATKMDKMSETAMSMSVSKKLTQAKKNLGLLFTVLPLAFMIHSTYRKEVEENGLKGYKKATNKVISRELEKKQMESYVRKIIR